MILLPGTNYLIHRELGVAAASVASNAATGESDLTNASKETERSFRRRERFFFSRRRAARGAPGVPSRVGAEGAEETIEGVPF